MPSPVNENGPTITSRQARPAQPGFFDGFGRALVGTVAVLLLLALLYPFLGKNTGWVVRTGYLIVLAGTAVFGFFLAREKQRQWVGRTRLPPVLMLPTELQKPQGSGEQWWLLIGSEVRGPFSTDEVRRRVANGAYYPGIQACPVGATTWCPIHDWSVLCQSPATGGTPSHFTPS